MAGKLRVYSFEKLAAQVQHIDRKTHDLKHWTQILYDAVQKGQVEINMLLGARKDQGSVCTEAFKRLKEQGAAYQEDLKRQNEMIQELTGRVDGYQSIDQHLHSVHHSGIKKAKPASGPKRQLRSGDSRKRRFFMLNPKGQSVRAGKYQNGQQIYEL